MEFKDKITNLKSQIGQITFDEQEKGYNAVKTKSILDASFELDQLKKQIQGHEFYQLYVDFIKLQKELQDKVTHQESDIVKYVTETGETKLSYVKITKRKVPVYDAELLLKNEEFVRIKKELDKKKVKSFVKTQQENDPNYQLEGFQEQDKITAKINL